ncbi:hypothetical protein J9303_02815 [Bacillaceae bacterium Marseille-Q3522]|nr:hypothetical protein [Bacillaceae bacterium Marseille-Q3522]
MLDIHHVAIIPLITGLVELSKKYGLPVKWAPIVSVLLGLVIGIVYIEGPLKNSVLIGLMLGLSATGLYSGSKNFVEKK